MPNAIALIPARSGSERVPDKNVRPLAGHPLIAYAIATARQADVFDRVVCSTDSGKIAEVAKRYGADIPFFRPAQFATATSPDIEWITHTLENLEEHYDLFAIVRATNPFRGPDAFRRAMKQLLATPEADSIRAVELVKQHPGKMWIIEDKTMRPLLDQSQLDVAWHIRLFRRSTCKTAPSRSRGRAWSHRREHGKAESWRRSSPAVTRASTSMTRKIGPARGRWRTRE